MYVSGFFFRPWLKNLFWSMIFFLSSVGSFAYAMYTQRYLLFIGFFIFSILGVIQYKYYQRRSFGKKIEKKYQKEVKKKIKSTPFSAKFNIKCLTGGDIDIVLFRRNKNKDVFTVEIKSWHGLRVNQGNLVKMNGKSLIKDPILQAKREADDMNGYPVIWMPLAKFNRRFFHRNVLIVMGTTDFLFNAIEKSV